MAEANYQCEDKMQHKDLNTNNNDKVTELETLKKELATTQRRLRITKKKLRDTENKLADQLTINLALSKKTLADDDVEIKIKNVRVVNKTSFFSPPIIPPVEALPIDESPNITRKSFDLYDSSDSSQDESIGLSR